MQIRMTFTVTAWSEHDTKTHNRKATRLTSSAVAVMAGSGKRFLGFLPPLPPFADDEVPSFFLEAASCSLSNLFCCSNFFRFFCCSSSRRSFSNSSCSFKEMMDSLDSNSRANSVKSSVEYWELEREPEVGVDRPLLKDTKWLHLTKF